MSFGEGCWTGDRTRHGITFVNMRRLIFLFLLSAFAPTLTQGQKVMRLVDARDIGLTTEHMDSLYRSAFNMQDSTDRAFPGREDAFLELWPGTLQALGGYLHRQGFRHPQDIPITYRIFFATDGRIEHFHYAIREAIDPALEQRFQQSVEQFTDDYAFPMKPVGRFKQCGKMVLQADPE